MFFQLHIRNTIHQKSAHTVIALVNRYQMSSVIQLIGNCQTGRTGTDDCHLFTGAYFWRICFCISFFVCIFNDSVLIITNSNRIIMQSTGTCCLAKRRADTGCEFREVIGLVQTFIGLLPGSHIDQIIPFRHQIVQRTTAGHAHQCHTGLAEGNAACHAARSLNLLFFL